MCLERELTGHIISLKCIKGSGLRSRKESPMLGVIWVSVIDSSTPSVCVVHPVLYQRTSVWCYKRSYENGDKCAPPPPHPPPLLHPLFLSVIAPGLAGSRRGA